MKKDRKQANQYDKIFKENIEAVIPSLMQNVLGITAVFLEELPDDIQHTKERKPDVLKRVTDTNGDTFVLQIEFQVVDEPEMVYRMLEYKAMLLRKYKIDVEQFVIYIGKGSPKMTTQFKSKGIDFEYQLQSVEPFLVFAHNQQDFLQFYSRLQTNQSEAVQTNQRLVSLSS